MAKIERICTRLYTDSDQRVAFVDWDDGSRTQGQAQDYHGVLVPTADHMSALFDRGLREGLRVERAVW